MCLLCWGALVGCAGITERQQSMDTLAAQVERLEAQLADAQTTLNDLATSQEDSQSGLAAQFATLDARLADMPSEMSKLCGQPATPAAECESQPATRTVVMSDDKMVVGELEQVWIEPPGALVIARVDTGADSSSVHAANMVEFERDGDDWVRFELQLNDEATILERQVVRYVRVYQQADRTGTRRPVVSIRARLGDVSNTFEFTLADRSHLEYQMLLGRNFLTDIALVDVGRQFVQPAYEPPGE